MSTPSSTPNLAGKSMSSSLKARLRRLKSSRSTPFTTPLSHRQNKSPLSNISKPEVNEDESVTHSGPIPINFNIDCDNSPSTSGKVCETSKNNITLTPTLDELEKCTDLITLQKWTKQCQERIEVKKETLRKLKLVKMYRTKNDAGELTTLIDKWREVSQQAIQDLHDKLPEPKPKLSNLLRHLQIDEKLLKFNAEYECFD